MRAEGGAGRAARAAGRLLGSRAAPILLILAGTAAAAAALAPSFRQPGNLANVVVQGTPLVLVAIAQTFAILVGDVDLSVGGIVSLATVLMATLTTDDPARVAAVAALVLALGASVGAANGWLASRVAAEPMVLTLATNVVLMGLALYVMPYPGGYVPYAVVRLAAGGPVTVALATALVLAATAAAWLVLNRARFGIHLRAVGADPQVAFHAGIPVRQVKVAAHAVAGLLAALGGLFLAARMGSGDALVGQPFSLDSMTAVIAGGASFSSGQGEVLGSVAGALLISLLSNILNHVGVSPYYQYVFKGVLLLAAVTAGAVRETRRRRPAPAVTAFGRGIGRRGPDAAAPAGGE